MNGIQWDVLTIVYVYFPSDMKMRGRCCVCLFSLSPFSCPLQFSSIADNLFLLSLGIVPTATKEKPTFVWQHGLKELLLRKLTDPYTGGLPSGVAQSWTQHRIGSLGWVYKILVWFGFQLRSTELVMYVCMQNF